MGCFITKNISKHLSWLNNSYLTYWFCSPRFPSCTTVYARQKSTTKKENSEWTAAAGRISLDAIRCHGRRSREDELKAWERLSILLSSCPGHGNYCRETYDMFIWFWNKQSAYSFVSCFMAEPSCGEVHTAFASFRVRRLGTAEIHFASQFFHTIGN